MAAEWYYADSNGNFFQVHQLKHARDIVGFLTIAASSHAAQEVQLSDLRTSAAPGWYSSAAAGWYTFDGKRLLHYAAIEIPAAFMALQRWADPLDPAAPTYTPKSSLAGPYSLDFLKRPVFPIPGAEPNTPLPGRGKLGCWGPNWAADPIIMIDRFEGGAPFRALDAVLIQRQDTGQWAIPGGMVDVEDVLPARGALREFLEEAFGGQMTVEEFNAFVEQHNVFTGEVFKGIVDKDPRNTYHAWMETTAFTWVLNGSSMLPVIELHKVVQIKKQGTTTNQLQKFYIYVAGREQEFIQKHPTLPITKVSLLEFFRTNMASGDDAVDVKLAPIITASGAADVALYANHTDFVYSAVLAYIATNPTIAKRILPNLMPLKARIQNALVA